MKRSTLSFALVALCSAGATVQAGVDITLSSGVLKKFDGSALADGSTMMLICDADGDGFGNLLSSNQASNTAFINDSGDVILKRWAMNSGSSGVPGVHVESIQFNLTNGVNAADSLILVWYAGLVESTHPASPGPGRRFGTYRAGDWTVPPDGSSVSLNMLTTEVGGNLPPAEGKVDQITKSNSSNQPPVAICRSVTNSVTTNCTVAVTAAQVDNGSFDPNGSIVNRILAPTGPFGIGTTPVKLTVVDNQGASNSCNTTVTVVDIAPPTITCPATLNRTTLTGQCFAVVTYAPTASDNCSKTVVCVPPSGSSFRIGTSNVVCTATDGSGNTAHCSFKVNVKPAVKPVVTVSATDAAASEPGTDTGKFTFSRTGCTNTPLQVLFSVSGTATPGADYTAFTGKTTIPAGKFNTFITVKPLDDATPEPVERVVVSMSTNASYNVGASSNATVNITSHE